MAQAQLVQARARELQAGRVYAPAVADLYERAELVDGEDVLDAVGQARTIDALYRAAESGAAVTL